MVNNLIIGGIFFLCSLGSVGYASELEIFLEKAPKRTNELVALQNGAKIFINHCLNCHSASFMRYNKLKDIGLTSEQIKNNLLFTGEKIGDLMNTAISNEDAKNWFGTAPPDLSVIVRAKSNTHGASGTDYIYNYMLSFYRDISKPTGWDNLVFPDVSMPHPLWNYQGPRKLVITKINKIGLKNGERIVTTFDQDGFSFVEREIIENFHGKENSYVKFIAADQEKSEAYESDIADLAAFMTWMAEPEQLTRKRIGVCVLFFLGILFIIAWKLNQSYWKYIK